MKKMHEAAEAYIVQFDWQGELRFDIIAIENTRHYNGLYHVLEGLISPMDGIGPEQLNIQT